MGKEITIIRDRIARYRTLLAMNTDREAQKIIREFLTAAEAELKALQTRTKKEQLHSS
jgi:hypothetical protein